MQGLANQQARIIRNINLKMIFLNKIKYKYGIFYRKNMLIIINKVIIY